MTINCNEGDECRLFCLSNKGCEYLTINGCDNIYVCPTINNNCKPAPEPTYKPTYKPTVRPTHGPTPHPTNPTFSPTSSPTE